jgi:putative hydrolase of the HAD superfamily
VIRTVIFDLGRVLVPFDFSRAYTAMAGRTGLEPAELRDRIKRLGIVGPFEGGAMDEHEFRRAVLAELGAEMDHEEFCSIWFSIFLPELLIPEEMVKRVRAQRRTVLLSNTNSIHFRLLKERYPVLEHFDAYILSYEVKAMKPDPRIFAAAVEAAQCRPEECFFTDDIAAYVEGARACGIDAVVFESAEQTARELRARGLDL